MTNTLSKTLEVLTTLVRFAAGVVCLTAVTAAQCYAYLSLLDPQDVEIPVYMYGGVSFVVAPFLGGVAYAMSSFLLGVCRGCDETEDFPAGLGWVSRLSFAGRLAVFGNPVAACMLAAAIIAVPVGLLVFLVARGACTGAWRRLKFAR